ncbi:MAG: leucine--tRNA ligase, partial [archaeon]
EEFIQRVMEDVKKIKELSRIEKPKKITVFVAEEWKWKVLLKVFKLKEKEKRIGFGEAINEARKLKEAKEKGKELQKFVQVLVKKINEIREVIEIEEYKCIHNSKTVLEKEFNAKIELVKAGKSKEGKARNAFPLKPAILIE